MPMGKLRSLEKILDRVDDLDSTNLAILVQRLAKERKLLKTVLNTIREGILIINEDGLIEYANEAAAKMIGFKLADVGRVIIWKLVPDLIRTLDFASDGTFGEVSLISREVQLTYPENRYIRVYLMPFEYSREKPSDISQFVVILSDISVEKASTREKIEDERISSILMLAAGVAHELGNPLNSLTIHLQLIKRSLGKLKTEGKLDKIKESLAICGSEVERLDGIITHFLEAVRPRAPDFQDLDLFATMEAVLGVLGKELKDRKVRVDIEVEETLPVVAADANQIKQVYFNILKNAADAMEGGGTIKIRARSDDEFVFFQIGDSGKGIEKDDLSKVFQPYYSTRKGGHGLGMMISQRIMRDHGGRIGIDSRSGTGTVVTLQFPQKHRRIRLLNQ